MPTQKRSIEKKEKIIEKGFELMCKNGYYNTNTNDIAKYAEGSDKAKIKAIFDSIPAQLNEKNRRFKLNSINASARHIRYEDSFNWLADAGVALPCYNVTEPQAPLQLSEKRNLFKLYMNDVGLHTELVEIKSGSDFKKHLAMDHVGKRAGKTDL